MSEDKKVPFSFKKEGIYYFERRVPSDLKTHYRAGKIVYSLRTRSARIAAARAYRSAQQLDDYWCHLRFENRELPGKHLLRVRQSLKPTVQLDHVAPTENAPSITLSEAVAVYLKVRGAGRSATFRRTTERACGYLIDACGDKDLLEYTRSDATSFRDALLAKGLVGSSIARVLGAVRSVINTAASELGLSIKNPFTGLYFDRQLGVKDRLPLPTAALRQVQKECLRVDDELRWLVALLSDTGMRLAEAAGLAVADICLGSDIPHVVIRPHPWRPLKTGASERTVPLVGLALWAATRVVTNGTDSGHAFPRYNRSSTTKANAASAALNKWMKPMVPEGCTMHSFRHSMRDRLRAVECPADVVDQIGGWRTGGVGHSYGQGYPVEVLHGWLGQIDGVVKELC